MATKKPETISDNAPVGANLSPADAKLSKYEAALKLIANGDAMNKNDYSIQIAQKALAE